MGRTGSQKERPDDSRQRHQECSDAGLAHPLYIGFQAGDEHQDQAANLCHHQKRICRLSAVEEAEMEQIECAWTGDYANQEFP